VLHFVLESTGLIMTNKREKYVVTAGGYITCIRCKAQSSRTKEQCKNPALKNKTVCKWHGGISTGPRTKEGILRIREAHLKHGEATKKARQERSSKSAMLRYLTDLRNHCNLFYKELKTRGRPPAGYEKLDLTDPEQLVLELLKTAL
jgi:hypothetical protein